MCSISLFDNKYSALRQCLPALLAAMDRMQAYLIQRLFLPPPQVVRSKRLRVVGGAPEPLTTVHLGRIRDEPGAGAIHFRRGTLFAPE